MFLKLRNLLGLALALALLADSARASTIATIDQQDLTGGTVSTGATAGQGNGQSFTPTLTSIEAAEFSLATTSGSTTLRLDVYAGGGFGGTLLGSSGLVVITNTSVATTHFDLSAPVSLTPGNLYSLRVFNASGSPYKLEFAGGNPYAGGDLLSPAGGAIVGADMLFTEGLHAVPEPATSLLVGIGLAVVSAKGRRNRHRVA